MMSARSVDAKVPKGKPAGKGAKPPGRPSQTPVVPAPTGPGQRMTREAVEKLIETNGSTEYSLELQGQSFNTIEGLESYSKLRCLDLSWNALEAIHGLEALKQLRELKLYRNRLTSCDGLKELKLLEHLHLHGNGIRKISPDFQQLRALTFLRLDKNEITRIENLDRLGNLTYLDLSGNHIREAQGFRALRSLETLLLNKNELSAWGDIPTCVSLQVLEVDHNQLSSLKPLATLTKLSELRCGHNCLVSLQVGDSPATTLPSLTELFVAGNALHTLASVSAFPALEVLDVCGNTLPFADIARHIQTLTALSDLSFEGNPLPVPQDFVSVLKRGNPELERIDGKPIIEALEETGTVEFRLRPGTAAGQRPGTPGTMSLAASFALGRPASATSSRRPSTAGSARPGTPGSVSSEATNKSSRPVVKTALSKTGPLAKLASTEELASATNEALSKLTAMRAAIADVMRKLGSDVPQVAPPPPVPASLQTSRMVSNEKSTGAPKESSASVRPPLDKRGNSGFVTKGDPSPPVGGAKPSVASPKTASVSRRSPSPIVHSEEEPMPLFSTPAAAGPSSAASATHQPLFIKSTRRRDASTGKLLPLPAEPPQPAVAAGIAMTGSGPLVRPSTATSVDSVAIARTIGLRVSVVDSRCDRPPSSGAMTERTLYLQPDTVSPRYVSDKTAELRPRPAGHGKSGLNKFRIPDAAKSQIRKDLVSGGTSTKLLAHNA